LPSCPRPEHWPARTRRSSSGSTGYRRTSAGTGRLVSAGGRLNAPLGLTLAPNHNILTVNGGDGRGVYYVDDAVNTLRLLH